MQRKGSRHIATSWPRLRQRKHRPRAHLLKARLRSNASVFEDGSGKERPERRPEPTSCQPPSPSKPEAGARGARGLAEGSSANSAGESSAEARGLWEQRCSLSAEEKNVGLKGDGGRDPGGGGGRSGAGSSAAIVRDEDGDRRGAKRGSGR
jgi:hypothetical protein